MEEQLKDFISVDEMYNIYEKYAKNSHIFKANKVRVGKFAKELGYVPGRQTVNGKNFSFYYKENK